MAISAEEKKQALEQNISDEKEKLKSRIARIIDKEKDTAKMVALVDEEKAKTAKKIMQLQNQKNALEKRQGKQERKIDDRRKIIIGGLVSKYFPEVLQFNPQGSNADNNIEFAPLANFLYALANDKQLVEQIKEKARQQK